MRKPLKHLPIKGFIKTNYNNINQVIVCFCPITDLFRFALWVSTIHKTRPERNKNVEITSAWVGCNPNKLSLVFTLIFSIKNRSNPLNIRYKAIRVPGTFNLFLRNHRTRKRARQTRISYNGVGYTPTGNSLQNLVSVQPGIGTPTSFTLWG